MNSNNLLSNISLCRKAGKVTTGFDAVCDNFPKAALVFALSDVSPKTLKELRFKAEKAHREVRLLPLTMDEAADVFGKRTGVFSVDDKGLAKIFVDIT
ncbi:MAG: 50S ribosomal protein L7 [Oscillospiraceae bacterium]|nr:50S ribosomal protein L7 [Oscillospiraceae bacterium]